MTPGVTTEWCRAPEVALGMEYGAAVDVWALGVVLVEIIMMWTGVPFPRRLRRGPA